MTRSIRTLLPGAEAVADLAVLAVPSSADDDDAEEPVLAARGVLRVAARFTGEETLERKNRMTDGRLAVARMIGYGDNARDAQLGLHRTGCWHLPSRGTGLLRVPACPDMRQRQGLTEHQSSSEGPMSPLSSAIQSQRCGYSGACSPAPPRCAGTTHTRRPPWRPPSALAQRRCGRERADSCCGRPVGRTSGDGGCSREACRAAFRYRSSA